MHPFLATMTLMLTKHTPIILTVLIAIALVTTLSIGKNAIQINRQGDAAIFEQLIENISAGKGFSSNVFANTQSFIEEKQFIIATEELIASRIAAPEQQERNMLGFHAYYILTPLSLLHPLLSSSLLLIIIQTSCFCGLLLAAYFFVKATTGSYCAALLLPLFIALNPNWFIGIMGQFYPDRVFVLAGFALCMLLYCKAKPIHIIATLIIIVLINERAGAIAGLIICAHSFLFFQRESSKHSAIGMAIGILGIAYFYFQKNYLLENVYYNNFIPRSLAEAVRTLGLPGFTDNIILNLKNNSVLLMFSFFAPRYFLITLAVMLPNMIGNIGGGEKVNWLTHYHSYYFPVLAFSAVAGGINLFNYCQRSRSKKLRLIWFVCVIFILLLTYTAQNYYRINKFDLTPSTGLKEYAITFKNYASGQPTGLDFVETIRDSFSEKDIVATTELGMALLHNKVKIHVFPIGLATATKIFISCPLLEKRNQDESMESTLLSLGFKRSAVSNGPAFLAISYCLLERQ